MPDLVAEPADIWTLAALTDTIAILRSLAEVCGLDAINEVLDSADGFALLSAGQLAFTGRNGEKLWNEIGAVVVDRWDEVVDALDAIVTTPEVDRRPWRWARPRRPRSAPPRSDPRSLGAGRQLDGAGRGDELDEDRDEDLEFWDETGVDCLEVTIGGRTGYTLRCYLGEDPVFLAERRPDPDLLLAGGPGELPDDGRPAARPGRPSRSGRRSARRSPTARRRCWPDPRTPT